MNQNEYVESAMQFYKGTLSKAGETQEAYLKKSMLNATLCTLSENADERIKIATGKPATAVYRELLKFNFYNSGEMLKKIAVKFPDDPNIIYLQNAYKIISYKTAIHGTGKGTAKTMLHNAFFPFIDTMETLRRASYLLLCPVWAGGANSRILINTEWGKQYRDKSVTAMKAVSAMYYDPLFISGDKDFLSNYENFKAMYFAGAEHAGEVVFKPLEKETRETPDREAILETVKKIPQQIKESFPPTPKDFLNGVRFYFSKIKETLIDLNMDCNRGYITFVPAFKGNLQPLFNYTAEKQEAYLQKLAELQEQRDKNAILILQEADKDTQDETSKYILSGLYHFYHCLREILPPDQIEKELEIIAQAEKVSTKKPQKIDYPIDKVNNNLWNDLEYASDAQLAFTTGEVKGREVNVIMGINFATLDGVKITKSLTHFDKRVYIAVSALWNAGNKVITLTQIHYTMGNTQRPAKNQLEKINESVSKMMGAWLYLDNAEEVHGKFKYPKVQFHYDASLLPMERITVKVKGLVSDIALHIFREPPLMSFARDRKQITTFEAKMLQSPLSKTDGNLAIEDYLLERIAGAKHKGLANIILFETIFQKNKITGRVQKARTIDKIKKYFAYYKDCGQVKRYVVEPDKITFYF